MSRFLTREDSESSFQNRQYELKEACHNFKEVLSDFRNLSHQSSLYGDDEITELQNTFLEQRRSVSASENFEIRELIKELYSMKTDLLDLKMELKRIKSNDPNLSLHISNISSKISLVIQTVSRHITRAELLLV